MSKTRRGTDVLAPGTRVRVVRDCMAFTPEDSEFIGREGVVGSGNAGIDVLVALEGDTRERVFALSELEVAQAARS